MIISFQYFYIVLPAILLALYAQGKVKSTFNKYSKVKSQSGLTGATAAERILNSSGIYDVNIKLGGGFNTNHYNPQSKELVLSKDVYNSSSIAALGVAAHEAGHAIQHAEGYKYLNIRSGLVPITQLSSKLSMPLILIGVLLSSFSGSQMGTTLVVAGIIFFAVTVVFAIATLPVEFNASSRAIAALEYKGILSQDELKFAEKTLNAAALTYVASAAVAIAELLRFVLIFLGGNRD